HVVAEVQLPRGLDTGEDSAGRAFSGHRFSRVLGYEKSRRWLRRRFESVLARGALSTEGPPPGPAAVSHRRASLSPVHPSGNGAISSERNPHCAAQKSQEWSTLPASNHDQCDEVVAGDLGLCEPR